MELLRFYFIAFAVVIQLNPSASSVISSVLVSNSFVPNSINLNVDVGSSSYSLSCNTSDLNQEIKWIQTFNKTKFYYLKESNRYVLSNNSRVLTIQNILLSDEEYYACGYVVDRAFRIVTSYYLYVKGT